jgi:hypothetical protein
VFWNFRLSFCDSGWVNFRLWFWILLFLVLAIIYGRNFYTRQEITGNAQNCEIYKGITGRFLASEQACKNNCAANFFCCAVIFFSCAAVDNFLRSR